MASFAPVPDVPLEGLNLAESSLFKALKENVEILAGTRTQGVRAITSDVVTIQATDNQGHPRVTAAAFGYATTYTNGAQLAAQTGNITIISVTDYVNLVQDVQNVMNDLAKVQNALNSLIGQLRS